MKFRKRPITAGDVIAMNQSMPYYDENMAEYERQREDKLARQARAAEPIVAKLRSAGADVARISDLRKLVKIPDAAVLVLIDELESGPHEPGLDEMMARALRNKAAMAHWERIRDLYLRSTDLRMMHGLAVALSSYPGAKRVGAMIDLVETTRLGETRVYFLEPIWKQGRPADRHFVRSLAADPEFAQEVARLEKKKLRVAEDD